ncbi:histidine triad nucleotide-binding protein [Candidatus Poribacteria bacterium]|jgi:histidine triad (HIT) family protein|nr:histidine triad nucleotide-binding protein [Candidatus Poribacteria bacterium]MBT5536415.1 histidine triad nucleotide-binding protein [Candidatus Poribacteria bacterium]MBT5709422.1 histidine triad nucleotide-binding protein [Candidatus Poribacteria bacterium]MBT7100637.1 histidine triad nucleotide-binding protein [Candidatus Poribacteria bacterium]MBT7808598.1 histidine triad nucleotide-binding protein [Candidatus Poribacteria bacterium]
MADTIFSRIMAREISADIVFEDDDALAFRDIDAKAPTHVLVIPKRHIATVADASHENAAMLGSLLVTAARVASDLGLSEDGYRLVINHGRDGGQTVEHLHIHILGGRPMAWPPG